MVFVKILIDQHNYITFETAVIFDGCFFLELIPAIRSIFLSAEKADKKDAASIWAKNTIFFKSFF